MYRHDFDVVLDAFLWQQLPWTT